MVSCCAYLNTTGVHLVAFLVVTSFRIMDTQAKGSYVCGRSLWERYCRGVQAIVFVADAADTAAIDTAAAELHSLVAKPSLAGACDNCFPMSSASFEMYC